MFNSYVKITRGYRTVFLVPLNIEKYTMDIPGSQWFLFSVRIIVWLNRDVI